MKIAPARLRAIQDQFEEDLPKMRNVLRFRLRCFRGEKKEEAMAEATAICWKDYLGLHMKKRDPRPLANKIAEYAARSVLSDRGINGQASVNDVMSHRSKHKYGHIVQSSSVDQDENIHPELLDGMRDTKMDSPVDQAAANIDYAQWLNGLDPKHRQAAVQFASGRTNTQVGAMIGLGRGTGHHLRRELRESWERMQGEISR